MSFGVGCGGVPMLWNTSGKMKHFKVCFRTRNIVTLWPWVSRGPAPLMVVSVCWFIKVNAVGINIHPGRCPAQIGCSCSPQRCRIDRNKGGDTLVVWNQWRWHLAAAPSCRRPSGPWTSCCTGFRLCWQTHTQTHDKSTSLHVMRKPKWMFCINGSSVCKNTFWQTCRFLSSTCKP